MAGRFENGIQLFLLERCTSSGAYRYQGENAVTPLNSGAHVLIVEVIRQWMVDVSQVSASNHRYPF